MPQDGIDLSLTLNAGTDTFAATLTCPTAKVRSARGLLLLHGYGATRDEFELCGGGTLFGDFARAAAAQGWHVMRPDLAPPTNTVPDWEAMVGRARTADAELEAVLSEVDAGPSEIAWLGFSQGSLVALCAAHRTPSRLVLWSPVLDPVHTYTRIFGSPVPSAATLRPLDRLACLSTPILAVGGGRDPWIAYTAPLLAALDARPNVTFSLTDTGHDLGTQRDPQTRAALFKTTLGFLETQAGAAVP